LSLSARTGKIMSKTIKIRDLEGLGRWDRELTIMRRWGRRLKAPWRTSSRAGRCCSSSHGWCVEAVRDLEEGHQDPRLYGRRRGKTGVPISSRSGRWGPAPGEGPRHRPLGLGGGAGSQWADRNGWPASSWVGASVWSTEWRRWVGQKGERGREIVWRERRKISRMVCFDRGLRGDPREARDLICCSAQNQKAIVAANSNTGYTLIAIHPHACIHTSRTS
jgi:hypothetical protein